MGYVLVVMVGLATLGMVGDHFVLGQGARLFRLLWRRAFKMRSGAVERKVPRWRKVVGWMLTPVSGPVMGVIWIWHLGYGDRASRRGLLCFISWSLFAILLHEGFVCEHHLARWDRTNASFYSTMEKMFAKR